jgi:transcriptional regulator with XRE-family HTH domain
MQLKELYNTMNVGEKIKKLRELKNFTQQHMAQELNLSLSGYGKIERNETDISISKLEKISAILGVDINTILSFDEKHIFNFNNNQTANGIVQNQYTTQTELIEKLIEQYKNENSYLKELVKTLTTK